MIGVYGATGFIGRHLVRRLVAMSGQLKAVARRFPPDFSAEFSANVELLEADLLRPLEIGTTVQGLETVVQLISTSSPDAGIRHMANDIRENVVPHTEFIQHCVAAGVKRYVFLSSGGTIYGPDAPIPTPESYAGTPISSYGLTKLFVEKCVQMHGYVDGLEYFILRLSNPFGPGQQFRRGQGLIPAAIGQYRRNQPVRIFGNGSAERDYIFIDDAVEAILAAIRYKGEPREVVNIGNGRTHSVTEIVAMIEQITGYRFDRISVPTRESDVQRSCLDIRKARELLSWTPSTAMRKALEVTLSSY